MRKKLIKASKNAIKIKTPTQASFHLSQGEVLALPISQSECIYVFKDDKREGIYKVAVVPKIGLTKHYEGDIEAVLEMVNNYDFYVVKGGYLEERKITVLDKVFNRFQLLIGRKMI